MNLQFILDIIINNLKNKTDKQLLQYSFLVWGILYFSQGFSINQALLISIFAGIIMWGLKEDILNLSNSSSNKISASDVITKMTNKVNIPTSSNNLSNEQQKNLSLNLNHLKSSVKNIAKYLIMMRKRTKDSNYTDIIIEVTKLISSMSHQIDLIINSLNNDYSYSYLSYEKLKDIEKELVFQINALYFKNDENFDKEINEILTNLDNELKEINKTIIDIINEDYKQNISSSKKIIDDIDTPDSFNA
jgi:hypothetical protein